MSTETLEAETQVPKLLSEQKKERFKSFSEGWNNRNKDEQGEQSETTDATQATELPEKTELKNPVIKDGTPPEKKKKLGFTKTLIQQVKEAELEKKRFEQSLSEQQAEKTKLEAQIAELNARIDGADTKKERDELHAKLQERETYAETISNENKQYREKLDLLDTVNSPVFQEKFLRPVQESHTALRNLLNNDSALISELDKAISADSAALTSNTQEERTRNEQLRDEIYNAIYEQLLPGKQGQFSSIFFTSFLPKSHAYYEEVAKGPEMVKKLRDEQAKNAQEAQIKFKNTWNGAFDESNKSISDESKPSEAVEKVIKAQKIDDSIEADMEIAKDTITGGSRYNEKDVARVIAQGAHANRYKAQIQAQNVIIRELEESIAKYKGTSTAGNGSHAANKVDETLAPRNGTRAWALAKWGVRR